MIQRLSYTTFSKLLNFKDFQTHTHLSHNKFGKNFDNYCISAPLSYHSTHTHLSLAHTKSVLITYNLHTTPELNNDMLNLSALVALLADQQPTISLHQHQEYFVILLKNVRLEAQSSSAWTQWQAPY